MTSGKCGGSGGKKAWKGEGEWDGELMGKGSG